jgi:hypothetical protein
VDGGLLVGGGKFAELGHGVGNDGEREINIGLRSMTAKAEAQAGACFFGGQANRSENM